jgi:DNA (cytosine-5)-methyltransferase 1
MDRHATLTYRLNHPAVPESNVFTLDLEKTTISEIHAAMLRWENLLVPGKVHVITAGIPCQGFSKAGYRTRPGVKYDVLKDPRNHLYKVVIKWTRKLQPRYVVIENVPEMRTVGEDEKSILASVKAAFEKLGYFADFDVVDASDFGVAQKRQRLILIASHPDVAETKVQDLESYHCKQKKLMEVIGHLPAVEVNAGAWYMLVNGKIVTGHKARFNNPDDLEIFAAIQPGENYVAFIERCRDILEKRLNHSSRKVYSTDSFPDKFFKLRPDEPSRTIVAHLQRDGNGYIHPDQVRSITPREAALIQGFDEGFVFAGGQGNQFIQIGNAVPPPLAGALARLLVGKLKKGAK